MYFRITEKSVWPALITVASHITKNFSTPLIEKLRQAYITMLYKTSTSVRFFLRFLSAYLRLYYIWSSRRFFLSSNPKKNDASEPKFVQILPLYLWPFAFYTKARPFEKHFHVVLKFPRFSYRLTIDLMQHLKVYDVRMWRPKKLLHIVK